MNGNPAALTQQERRGLGVFRGSLCGGCHTTALLSDNNFHNTGVTPNFEDEGRFAVTGLAADRGRFKTPVLRNLENQTSFMHNGAFSTLEEVVDFYDRGGDFNNPNLDPRMVPLNLSQNQKDDLVAFLKRPLTDQRVVTETGPFSRPTLYTESDRVPQITQTGIAGFNSKIPVIMANQPPLLGNSSFTIAIENALPLAPSVFVMGLDDPGTSSLPLANNNIIYQALDLSDGADGHGTLSLRLPGQAAMDGVTLFGRWYVEDATAANGYAISPLLEITLFKPEFGVAEQIFVGSFE